VFDNGVYTCKESYDVNITKDVQIFKETIGFIQQYKMDKIKYGSKTSRPTYTSKKEVVYLGDYEVFDITVDNKSHTYWTGGLSVSNCAEQSLNNFETCCLAEIYLPNIESYEELKRIATMLYRVNKHSLALKCHHQETQDIVNANMRMGIGITGVMMSTEEQKSWLSDCYTYLRAYDKEYSQQMGWPTSIKLTTVKPSGTLSLLAGVTSGVHPATSGQYFIRRIRIASNSDLVNVVKAHGYHTEFQKNFDGTEDRTTVVVEFPCKYPDGVISADDLTVFEQLEAVKFMQKNWSDNSVSVTAYYKKHELPELRKYLEENFKDGFKTLSFLLYSDHGFAQAPFEPISKEKYEYLNELVKPIDSIDIREEEMEEIEACASGACPIK
jgi:hypothetical protein